VRLSVALTLGIPVAALALTATALGPDRLSNLRCHVVGCSAVQRVERLCEVAASVAPLPPELRAAAGADALEGHWPTEAQRALWAALHEGRPGQADDVLLDVLEAEGERAMRCPALGVTLNAPVAITPARVVVQGRTLLRLEDGRIPERYLGAMGLDIAGLAEALGYHPDGSAVRVSAPSEAAFELLTQIVHTLGRQLLALDRPREAPVVGVEHVRCREQVVERKRPV